MPWVTEQSGGPFLFWQPGKELFHAAVGICKGNAFDRRDLSHGVHHLRVQ